MPVYDHNGKSLISAKAVILSGMLVGLLDAAAAVGMYMISGGKDPFKVFQFIASAVFGSRAYNGGFAMALTGFAFHMLIAYAFTIFFFFVYPGLRRLLKHKIIIGVVYGMFTWIIMNLVVLPLTKIPSAPFRLSPALTGISIVILAIGLPLALVADNMVKRKNSVK